MVVAVTVTDRDVDAANQTTYTITAVDFGATASDRFTAFGVRWREAGGTDRSVSSVTINGEAVPAGQIKQAHNVEGGAAVAYVLNPTGTSGTVEVTFSGGVSRVVWAAGRITGASATLVAAVEAEAGQVSGDTTQSANLNVVANGGVFGFGGGGTAGAVLTLDWTGLTDDTTVTTENAYGKAGIADISADETPRTVSLGYDVPTTETIFGRYAVVLSFAPGSTDGVFSSAGIATASFTGAANADGVLASAGVATAQFETGGVFISAGVATAAFVGNALKDGVFAAAGVGAAAFDSGIRDATFTIAGAATALFETDQGLLNTAFSISAVATATFTGVLLQRWTPDEALAGNWTEEDELL